MMDGVFFLGGGGVVFVSFVSLLFNRLPARLKVINLFFSHLVMLIFIIFTGKVVSMNIEKETVYGYVHVRF